MMDKFPFEPEFLTKVVLGAGVNHERKRKISRAETA